MGDKKRNDMILAVIFNHLRLLDNKELIDRLYESEKALSAYEAIGIIDGNPTYFDSVKKSKDQIDLLRTIMDAQSVIRRIE